MSVRGKTDNKAKEVLELTRMTKKGIQALCKKNKLYQTPELNDVLYLHYQGYRDIECLEEYIGLKCLWLENNAISEIAGLDHQKLLKCLFLNNNLIKKIENLENCPELDTLNLANNHITRIENCGVDKLPVLTTLILSHNYIKNAEQLGDVVNCKMLSVLDLAHNRIDDILVVKVFAQMPELRVLDLDGNPVVNKIPQYRKTLILECKNLTHLDRRPVFPRDRACAEAWKRGGYEEERREHNRWNKAERRKIRESVNATLRLRNRGGGDPQVDLIPSSSDEDDTERTSAPPSEPPPKQQVADSLSIDENIQYVEYYDPESLPQPEGHREMQKCKICGRVECNYLHVEERPAIQKVLEAPEDVLAKSQAVIEGKEMGNTVPKSCENESNVVNIPNIFSVRYESENEDEQDVTTKQGVSPIQNQSATEQIENSGNVNKDDLYEKAYVNYLDTVDRLLYIESKMEAVKTAYSEETNDESSCPKALPNGEGIVTKTMDETTTTGTGQQVMAKELSSQESLVCQESFEILSKEDCQKEFSDHHEAVPLKCALTYPNLITKDSADSTSKIISNKTIPPQSEKKKVRIMIEAEVPENHIKIPTTPIPNRKGRKIDYTRVQDATKRTKFDRGSCNEDMLDIFSDWLGNLIELEPAPFKTSSLNLSTIDTLNFHSSAQANGVIQGSGYEKEAPAFDLADDKSSDNKDEKLKHFSQIIKSSDEDTQSSDSSKGFNDESNNTTENAEKTVTSIREFVSSYDAFLHSIEGRLHDISERCKVSCVPPEYLTEEGSQQGVNQELLTVSSELNMNELENRPKKSLIEHEPHAVDAEKQTENFSETCKIETKSLEEPNNFDDRASTTDIDVSLVEQVFKISFGSTDGLNGQMEGQIQFSSDNTDLTYGETSETAEDPNNNHFDTSQAIIDEENNNTLHPIDQLSSDSPKNNGPTYLPELVSTDEKLQGYYTEVGRRNSEIIQRLLDNPLTKKMSAEEICKDLQETTDEIRRLNREKQKHRVENAKEMVEVVYSHRDDYEGELEVVDNKLVIIHKKSAEVKDITSKDTCACSEEGIETLFSIAKSSEVKEEGACKPGSSSESWDELTNDLTELFVWDERTTELQKRVEFERGRGSKQYEHRVCENSFHGSYNIENDFSDMTEKLTETCDETYDCIQTEDILTVSEKIYFQDSWGSARDISGQPIATLPKYETDHLEKSVKSIHTERLVESPCSGSIQHEDSSEVYQEALSSYVISETSYGVEVFEPAQCEVNSPGSDVFADKYSKSRSSSYELKVCETENVWLDSTSSCDVLLGTTFESTLSSSCWDAEDEQTSSINLEKDFETMIIEGQEKNLTDEKRQRESIEVGLSDQEDSESHPVYSCLKSQDGRYTI